MDDKAEALLKAFQLSFGGDLANMKFLTGEDLTLQQRSVVMALASQALRDAILDTQFSRD